MTPLFLTTLLAGTQPICGTQVVSASSPMLTLYARDGSKAAEIKVKNNSLPAPLPVVQCGATKVLVRYQGQLLVAERWEIVFDQEPIEIDCRKSAGGSSAGQAGARARNGLITLACRPPPPPPAPRTPARKRGKKR